MVCEAGRRDHMFVGGNRVRWLTRRLWGFTGAGMGLGKAFGDVATGCGMSGVPNGVVHVKQVDASN